MMISFSLISPTIFKVTMKINYQIYNTPHGELKLASYDSKLIMCDWHFRKKRDTIDQRLQKNLKESFQKNDDETLALTRQQLNEYFTADRLIFELPLALIGTEFQKKVWQGLMTIPFGETLSYRQLATQLSKPNATRAVANANAANALSIIIPCHRVINTNGALGGYAGGLSTKKSLLHFEHKTKNTPLS